MEKRYNKDEKFNPDLLIDYPRKGQVCAVLHRRFKDQKEEQCFRGKNPFFCTKTDKIGLKHVLCPSTGPKTFCAWPKI